MARPSRTRLSAGTPVKGKMPIDTVTVLFVTSVSTATPVTVAPVTVAPVTVA